MDWLRFFGSRWRRRYQCHGDTVCCQYVDLDTCNSRLETHRRGRAKAWSINHS